MTNEDGIRQKITTTRQEFENDPRTTALFDKAIQLAKQAVHDQELHASNVRMVCGQFSFCLVLAGIYCALCSCVFLFFLRYFYSVDGCK